MFLRKKPKPTATDRQAGPARKATQTTKTKQSLLSLEPRLMFDAAAAATAVEVQSEQVAQDQAEAAVSSEAAGDDQTTEQNESQNLLQAIATYNPGESTTEVVFVDPTVPDCQTLTAGIGPHAEVIMLDPTRDGVEQIAESLAGRSGIDAIHLISHGRSGELQLGVGTLTAESMSGKYADELATIREALSDQADILVYGCDFAEGHDGQEATTLLSQLTGADVAASTDATGFAGLGGDWVLETQTGTIETQIAVDDGVQANWIGLLAGETPPTITNLSGDSLAYSEGAGAVVIERGGNAVVADVDSPNLDTGTLTVSIPAGGDSAEDALSIRNQGTGAGQIGVSGSTVTYGGTTIGTFAGGSSGSNLVITLNSNATPTAVTALVRNITYQNTDTTAPTTGARTVRFVLTDGDGGTSANYDTTVTVSGVNDAPTDLSLSANTVAENAANGTVVGTVSATDPDSGDTHTYALTDTAGGRFAIDSSAGAITVANGALLNYEAAPSHNVTVRVTDSGGLTYDETFTINLTDVNEAPTSISLSGNTVEENAANGTVVVTASTMDQDAGDSHTYQLMDNAGGRFAINSSTGQITVADGSLLDYESATGHSVIVRVTDSGGLTYDETFAINLTNVNEAPTGADATVTINEDISHTLTTANFGFSDVDAGDTMSAVRIDSLPSAGTLTLSGMAVTAGQVVTMADITAGNLVFIPAADANGTGYANFTFSVRDSNNAYDPTPNQLTFNVTAVNDAPTDLSLSANTVPENAANGTVVGTVSGTDPDVGDTKTYSLTDNAGGRFAINSATGVITVANGTLLDYESTPSHDVTVRVTDSGGMTYDETFVINLTNVNEAPTSISLSGNTVEENAVNGTVVGTVSTVDPDSGDTKTYTLTNSAGGRFAINSSTGVLTVANGSLLNYEAVTSHSITVRVTDSGGLTYDKTFTITLTDAYEPLPFPSMSGSSVASNSMVIHESGPILSSPDVSGETGRAEFRPSEDLRKAIEIMTETSPPIDTANLEGKHLGVVREEFFKKVESTTEEKEFLPAPLSENKIEGKVTVQDHGDSALLISDHHVDSQQFDRTSESAIGTTMAVGLAGIVLQGAVGTKERLTANIRRPREHAEGTSPDMESELSSEDDSRSLHNESEHDGPISSKPGAA